MAASPVHDGSGTVSTRRDHAMSLKYLRLVTMAKSIRSLNNLITLATGANGTRSYPDVKVTKVNIPSRDKARNIIAYRYERIQSADKGSRRKVHLNWHGSGWVVSTLGSDAEFCALLAHELDLVVFDCDYRKAPENPFPAAIEDVEDAITWALALGEEDQLYDTKQVSLSGFSAGANLALSASCVIFGDSASASAKEKVISSVIAFYPLTTLLTCLEEPKKAPIKTDKALPTWLINFFMHCYMTRLDEEKSDARISNIKADAKSFPETVLVVCGNGDTLYDDGHSLVKKLKEAGHDDATFEHVEGEGHAFDKGPGKETEKRRKTDVVYASAVEAVRRGLQAGKK